MALISDGSVVLLKYKLNNVCDADHRPANGAQRTMINLIYHNISWLSIRKYLYIVLSRSLKKANMHYLRIKCILQAHHENNAYCVRIERVLSAVLNRCVLKRVKKKSHHKVSHKGPLRDPPSRQPSDRKRIAYLVNAAAELIGLEFFPQYLTPAG